MRGGNPQRHLVVLERAAARLRVVVPAIVLLLYLYFGRLVETLIASCRCHSRWSTAPG